MGFTSDGRLQVRTEPLQDVAKTLDPLPGSARTGQLMVGVRNTHEPDRMATSRERNKETLGLLNRAAVVLFCMHDEERGLDRRGVREW